MLTPFSIAIITNFWRRVKFFITLKFDILKKFCYNKNREKGGMMTTVILLTLIFILLVTNFIQIGRFKKYFGRQKSIYEAIEEERSARLKDLNRQMAELHQQIEEERRLLREEYESKRAQEQADFADFQTRLREEKQKMMENFELESKQIEQEKKLIQEALDELKARKENAIKIMKEQEKEKNELDFHRIIFSEDELADIELLKQVEKRLHNKDVLRKLIYKTYIERPMNEMFARLNITTSPGIYKIEHIKSKKVYIGQSTNVKNRLRDHIKSAVGISTIANQAVHEAMAAEGIENFAFYLIDECDREKLNEREKYWIDFYKSNEWGYNRTRGGS